MKSKDGNALPPLLMYNLGERNSKVLSTNVQTLFKQYQSHKLIGANQTTPSSMVIPPITSKKVLPSQS